MITQPLKYSKHQHLAGQQVHQLHDVEQIVNTEWEVNYQFNSQGFRTSEFEYDVTCSICLGCSHTLGTGLPESVRWSNLIEQHTGITAYNLGQGGGSADTVTRLAMGWIDELKPETVFVYWPAPHRTELFEHTDVRYYNANSKFAETDTYIQRYFLCDTNSEVNYQKNQTLLRLICETKQIQLCELTQKDLNTWRQDHRHLPKSRDDQHWGAEYQREIADRFIRKL